MISIREKWTTKTIKKYNNKSISTQMHTSTNQINKHLLFNFYYLSDAIDVNIFVVVFVGVGVAGVWNASIFVGIIFSFYVNKKDLWVS